LTDPDLTPAAPDEGSGEPAVPAAPPGKHDAEVERLFGTGGPLGPAVGGFRPRKSQTEMAKAIAQAITGQQTLIAEAGTGTGKTFAYLVPALLWGGKTIVSTGTKNLQDQLFSRDIPTVRKALQAPVSVALLKGRANYLCHYHLERTLANGRMTSREDVGYLREISRFLKMTQTGDKAELARVPENAPVWNLVTSTRENCVGQECQYYEDCFVMKARREAQQADVVVVNHHLFFADVALKDTGVAECCRPPTPSFSTRRTSCRTRPRCSSARACRRRRCWNCAATCWPKACRMPAMAPTGARSCPSWKKRRATCG
jgi:ATP-dependent DNA helicase DinG